MYANSKRKQGTSSQSDDVARLASADENSCAVFICTVLNLPIEIRRKRYDMFQMR